MATPERPSSSVVNRNVCFQAEAKFASMAQIEARSSRSSAVATETEMGSKAAEAQSRGRIP